MGCSSGGAAALSMGWFGGNFQRIITYSGTFVWYGSCCDRLMNRVTALRVSLLMAMGIVPFSCGGEDDPGDEPQGVPANRGPPTA
jgi:hypothetical protein